MVLKTDDTTLGVCEMEVLNGELVPGTEIMRDSAGTRLAHDKDNHV